MNRRDVLIGSAALMAAPQSSFAAGSQWTLTAAAVTQQVVPMKYAGHTGVLGFNGSVPGPEIRAAQGERLSVRLKNNLDEGTAVHWHGVRLNNAMDGVPALTQDLVNPGDSFDYNFVPRDAGTYWYHSHYVSHQQVAQGLIGPLIIDEMTPPDVDHDLCVVLTDWKLDREGQLIADYDNTHDVAHAGRMGNFAKAFLPEAALKRGDRVRLRLINAAVDRIFPVIIGGLEGKVVALDGMPLAAPRRFDVPMMAPAQRMDIIADVTGDLTLEMGHRDGAYPLAALPVSQSRVPRDEVISALPPNDRPVPGKPSRDLTLTMMGGAMGVRHGGDDIWAFNNLSGMQPEPFGQFARGETAKISLVNDTRWPHGIHLHGHHFFELDANGATGDFRDTSLVNPGEVKEILCVFDNPGKWMLHCHMLSHQSGGMKTWIEVA